MQVHLNDPVTGEPRLLTIPEGDLLVVRPRQNEQHAVDDAMNLAQQIKASSPARLIVVLSDTVDVVGLDEAAMANFGWVRDPDWSPDD